MMPRNLVRTLSRVSAALLLLSCFNPTHAEDMAVSLHGSAQGGGIELTMPLSKEFNGRLAYHEYTYQGSDIKALADQLAFLSTDLFGITQSNNIYNHNGKQRLLNLMADWYPDTDSEYRFTFGLGYNNETDDFIGLEQITGGYNLGGTNYSAAQVGTLSGTTKYKGLAPYFGWGWGNPLKKENHWGFNIDMGLLYQGVPDITLTATGTVPAAAVEAERARLVQDALKWFALVSVGVSYQW